MTAREAVIAVLDRHEQLNSFAQDPDVPLDAAPSAACTCAWRGDDHQEHLADAILAAVEGASS